MDAKAWIALIALAVTLGGVTLKANDYFLRAALAGELFDQAAQERERGDLETQLALARLELDFTSDPDRREYLKARILILEKRLLELEDRK